MQSTNPPEPNLTSIPTHVSQCCVSLSSTLLQSTSTLLQAEGGRYLSIGSGTGLFEHLLLKSTPSLDIAVVELPNVNVYLDEGRVKVVNHSGAVCPLAAVSTVWMFVYPRSSKLLAEYVSVYGMEMVELVIMILPRCDKSEMIAPFLCNWNEKELQQAGLVEWECMVLLRKKGRAESGTPKGE